MTINYNEPVVIGDADEFGAYTSLSSEASHTLATNYSAIGLYVGDGFYPEGSGSHGTAVKVYSNIDGQQLESFVGLSLAQNVATMAKHAYGIKIVTGAEGASGIKQYGIFIDDVNVAPTCYAIFTKAGKIRFGNLAGSGDRQVWVHSDGTIYA